MRNVSFREGRLEETPPKLPFFESHFELLCVRVCEHHGACHCKLEWVWKPQLGCEMYEYVPTAVWTLHHSPSTKVIEEWPRNHLSNTEISAKRRNDLQIGSFSVWNEFTRSEGQGESLGPRMVLNERKFVSECPRYECLDVSERHVITYGNIYASLMSRHIGISILNLNNLQICTLDLLYICVSIFNYIHFLYDFKVRDLLFPFANICKGA